MFVVFVLIAVTIKLFKIIGFKLLRQIVTQILLLQTVTQSIEFTTIGTMVIRGKTENQATESMKM